MLTVISPVLLPTLSVKFLFLLQGLIPCHHPWKASPGAPRQMWSLFPMIHGVWLVPLSQLSCTQTCTIFDSACVLFSFRLVAPQGQGLLRRRKDRLCWSGKYSDCEILLESCKSYHLGKLSNRHTRSLCLITACIHARSVAPVMSDSMGCSPRVGSFVHGILQARIRGWVTMLSSRGSSQPRIELASPVSPALVGRFFTTSASWEAL